MEAQDNHLDHQYPPSLCSFEAGPADGEQRRQAEATFLGLPVELRGMIYGHLLEYRRASPTDPDHAGIRNPNSSTSGQTIYFEAKSTKPALLQLKLCNSQVRCEVHDLLRKKVTNQAGVSHLDIMVKGSCIWPTWLSLPLTAQLDPLVKIDLRIFEAKGFPNEFSTGAYRALWSLFNLLVFSGPCMIHGRGLEKPLSIGRLRFEIMLCFPTSMDDLFGTYREVFDRLEKLAYDNVGLGNVATIEACLGADRRVWKLGQLPTGSTFASRLEVD